MSTERVHPETLAGDPFVAALHRDDGDLRHHPCACNDGWVTIGHEVVDEETGEETIEYALYLLPPVPAELAKKELR